MCAFAHATKVYEGLPKELKITIVLKDNNMPRVRKDESHLDQKLFEKKAKRWVAQILEAHAFLNFHVHSLCPISKHT